MSTQFEDSISLNSLIKATKRCARGNRHKVATNEWLYYSLSRCQRLHDDILNGKYFPGHGMPFTVYEPKERYIVPPRQKDKVFQTSMVKCGVYKDFTKPLIYDNGACQENKGTEWQILRMNAKLEQFYRKYHTNKGYITHLDFKQYFPSTPHKESKKLISKYCTDNNIKEQLYNIYDSFEDRRDDNAIEADPFGSRGTELGSPVSQLSQLLLVNDIDQVLSRDISVFYTGRYMDDIEFITLTKERAKELTSYIITSAANKGLTVTEKGGTQSLAKGFNFLKKKFILTNTGKVIILVEKSKFNKEKRTLRKLKSRLLNNEITMKDIENHYESWMSGLMLYDCNSHIRKMNDYYTELFNLKPKYKCKKKSRRYKQWQ